MQEEKKQPFLPTHSPLSDLMVSTISCRKKKRFSCLFLQPWRKCLFCTPIRILAPLSPQSVSVPKTRSSGVPQFSHWQYSRPKLCHLIRKSFLFSPYKPLSAIPQKTFHGLPSFPISWLLFNSFPALLIKIASCLVFHLSPTFIHCSFIK